MRLISRFAPLLLALALPLPVAASARSFDPLTLVDPFVGTSGTDVGGAIDTFPGAAVPFGMVQWSPDTPSKPAGGGYDYGDKDTVGFGLTHLSGPGCSVYGDFDVLPTVGVPIDPERAQQPLPHAGERATPGWYEAIVGNPGIRTELTATPRTGLGRFTFPATQQADVLVNAASDQAGVSDASIAVVGSNEIDGSAPSGSFCGMPDTFVVYFVAQFDRPFTGYGTWNGAKSATGARTARGPRSGAWVQFDTSGDPQIEMKVGISYVSVAGARRNLQTENRGWDLAVTRARAQQRWRVLLGRVTVAGGTARERRTFYTALYHALLHPGVFSDVDGAYAGFDKRVHHARHGHAEYANFSDWDIYRTQVPLMALLAPREASDMMQSLVDAERQDGWLPRWALANGATSVMGGDSVDPVIAGAYAFGARAFDTHAALAAMVKGASDTSSPPSQGWYVERPELREYLQRGYIPNTHTTSVSPVPNGASETLEYALDDFSIAQLAQNIGNAAAARKYLRRSQNWATLFDTATGWIAPRDQDGAFVQTPIGDAGQSGFQEGNAAQYTWMVPQDLADLVRGMGGRAATAAKLDAFFSQLDAGQSLPYAWFGNEPSLGSPWVYLSAGEPWRTQAIVREAMTTLYDDTPDGIPGNDDLGAMSAWYVWCAMGLYPQNPAVRGFAIGSPLFTRVTVHAGGDGPTIELSAPRARDNAPYVRALRVNGKASQKTWIALPERGTLRLAFSLGPAPTRWGSGDGDAPPSYARGVTFPPATNMAVTPQSAAARMAPGGVQTLTFAVSGQGTLSWSVAVTPGLQVTPVRGTLESGAARPQIALQVTSSSGAAPGYYAVTLFARAGNGARLPAATIPLRVAAEDASLPLAFVENRFDNSVTPVDLATGVAAPKIAVGQEPRDAAFALGGTRLFVCDRGDDTVSVIDTARLRNVATIAVGHSPNGIVASPDGRTLWVANFDSGTVQAIDAQTFAPESPILVGVNPRSIATSRDGRTLYVTDQSSNTVVPVDVASRRAGAPIAVGSLPAGIAITPDGSALVVADFGSHDASIVNLATRKVTRIATGVSPIMVAISFDGRRAYVTNFATTTITPIDLATQTALPAMQVGGAPYGMAFSRDGKTLYVVARRDNDLVPVDLATGKAGAPIPFPDGPYTIAAP